MILHPFEYHEPGSLEDALALAEKFGEDYKFLAGGQSLLPMMKLGLLSPSHVIDLGRLKGLAYIRREGGEIAIGGLTVMSEVASSELLSAECPVFTDCAAQIADPLVRNMGTIGGNVCHADPANDIPAAAVAVSAEMVVAGPRGERKIPAGQFFLDTFTTALGRDEILREVRIPGEKSRGSAYAKLERQAGDFGIAAAAARIWLTDAGTVRECGIALTGVGPKVIRANEAETALVGKTPGSREIAEAARLAARDSKPVDDLRGPAEYKREMAAVMTKRALTQALKRSKGAKS